MGLTKMTVQSIEMLNGAARTITPAAVNQWGVSLINAGMGREGWGRRAEEVRSHTHLWGRGASVSDRRLKDPSSGSQPG